MSAARFLLTLPLLLALSVPTAIAAEDPDDPSDASSAEAEEVVVTASRKEQAISEVPASVSVLDARDLERSPADNMADQLRSIPGLNVSQTSAGVLSISARTATNVIPQGQLSIVDYRSIYQDFNGFTLWGTTPVEMEDLARIEVVRGPGSAVWGANALHGVVHMVTKAPKNMVGTRLKVGGGELGTLHTNLTHAGVSGRLGYRISGGYGQQDAFDIPRGVIPGTVGATNPLGTTYPVWENLDLERSQVNARLDFDVDERTTWSFSGGYASFQSAFMSPGGPSFTDDARSVFGKIDWTRDSMRVTAFMNRDYGEGEFQLIGAPFEQDDYTWNLDFSDTRTIGARHAITYGGNARYNTYSNTLAEGADSRETYGVFAEDDFYINDVLRLVAGARWDHVDPMGSEFSPRVSLLVTPLADHQFRASYNHAFQAPSVLQNYIDLTGGIVLAFPNLNDPQDPNPVPVFLPYQQLPNLDLEAKRLDAFELGWNGRFGDRLELSAVGFVNEYEDPFQLVPASFYSSSNPPATWPFDPALIDQIFPNTLVSSFQYLNLGSVRERGIELGMDLDLNRHLRLFGNWSWQDDPELEGFAPQTLPDGSQRAAYNIQPTHRWTAGANWEYEQFFGTGSVSYQGDAFWTDVLDSRFWGPTEEFYMVNGTVGVRLMPDVVVSVSGINLLDEEIQQHVWGDIIRRRVTGQVTYRF